MRPFELGAWRTMSGQPGGDLLLPPHHLLTHACVVGMTGSGKTGLLFVMVEEALRSGVPVLMIDLKGDLPNLALAFDEPGAAPFMPWAASMRAGQDKRPVEEVAAELAKQRQEGMQSWDITFEDLKTYNAGVDLRILTPGSNAGEFVHLLSALERPSARWQSDRESAQQSLSDAISLLLRLVGRDADPARSREHVLLSVLAERRLSAQQPADLPLLLGDLAAPPLERIGALELDAFLSKKDRAALAAGLNSLLASPTFTSWREGVTLDVAEWLRPKGGRTPAVIVSVAHLDD